MSVTRVQAIGAQLYRWLLARTRGQAYRPELHYMRGPGPKCAEQRLPRARVVSVHAVRAR
jgi:hypothetical protein